MAEGPEPLKKILNHSVVRTPTGQEDAQSRLLAAGNKKSESEQQPGAEIENSELETILSSARMVAGSQKDGLGPAASEANRGVDAAGVVHEDNNTLERVGDVGATAAHAARIEMIEQEAGRRSYSSKNGEHGVSATVDGNGKVLAVSISREILKSPHPQKVGPLVVELIGNARAAAMEEWLLEYRREFQDMTQEVGDQDVLG